MRKFSIFVSIISFIAAILCFFKLVSSSFAAVSAMPIVFSLFFPALFPIAYRNPNRRITVALAFSLFFIRMVFLPVYGILDGYYDSGISMTLSTYCNRSVLLSIYEFVAVSLILCLRSRSGSTQINRPHLKLSGNHLLYLFIVLVAVVFYYRVGRHLGLLEFGYKSIGGEYERSGDIELGGIDRVLIGTGITFLFFLSISYFSKRYSLHPNQKFVVYSIVVAMIMISIITGERRTSQIYKGFACIWLLIGLYPSYRKRITGSLLIVAALVIAGMTLYKQYHAFLYDSYAEALNHASGVGMSTGILDAYFYGVNTISKNLAFSDMGYVSYANLLYDFARNIFGLNFFVPRGLSLTSELYNLTLSSGEFATGYLLSSVGYGYVYFGFVLAPVFTCLTILILITLEKWMKSTSSLEMAYLWSFLFMRFGFGFLGSFPPLINMASRMLFVNGGIVLAATFFNKSLKKI